MYTFKIAVHVCNIQFKFEIIKLISFQQDLGNPSILIGGVDLLWGWRACWWHSPGRGGSGWCWPPLWDEPPWHWLHWPFLSRPGRLSSSWPHGHLDWDWLSYPAALSRSEEKRWHENIFQLDCIFIFSPDFISQLTLVWTVLLTPKHPDQ